MKKILFRFVGVLTLLIGVFLLQHAGKNILESITYNSWPSVEGKVTSSKLGSISATSTSRKNPIPIAKIEYVYKVAGVSYTSSRRSLNDYGSDIKGQQQKIVDRYPPGEKVMVFYNPSKPSSSVIEHKVPIGSYITVGGGMIFILVSYFFLFSAPKIYC